MALQYIEEKRAEIDNRILNGSYISGDEYRPDFYKMLSDLFRGSVTAQGVAEFLTSLADVHDDETVKLTLFVLWSRIWELARIDDKVHQQLLDLLVALSRLPDVSQCFGRTVWRDLPMFRWYEQDWYNLHDLEILDVPGNDEFRAEQIVQRERKRLEYQNQNAFLARMTELSHREGIRPLNYDLYGLSTMREALEAKFIRTNNSTMERYGKTIDNPTHFDRAVPAAAQWIFYYGPGLFKSVDDYTPTPRHCLGSGNAVWKVKHGFCKDGGTFGRAGWVTWPRIRMSWRGLETMQKKRTQR